MNKRIIKSSLLVSLYLFSAFNFLVLKSCAHRPEEKKTKSLNHQAKEINDKTDNLDLSEEVKEKFHIEKDENDETENLTVTEGDKESTDKSNGNSKRENSDRNPSQKIAGKNGGFESPRNQVTLKASSENYPVKFPEKYRNYDKLYKKVWDEFDHSHLKKKEKIEMRVSYLGLGMGSIKLSSGEQIRVGNQKAYHFEARLMTAKFYSYIYELDDRLSAQVLMKPFLPLRYSLIQRESRKEIDDIQLFDREKYLLYYRYRRWRTDKKQLTKKNEDIFVPKYSIDPYTLLYFVRGLKLAVGKKYAFPVVTRDKLWIFRFKVLKIEEIDTEYGKKQAFKVDAYIGEEGSFIKKGELNLWFGVDPSHILWQMRVGTKIGSLYSRIKSYESSNH